MTLFLDTEFNGHGGELISIALVSDRLGPHPEFYEVRQLPQNPTPWVLEHIIPVLNQSSVADTLLRMELFDFLHHHKNEPVYADWHQDLVHFLALLETEPGRAYPIELTLHLVRPNVPLSSIIPHNALSDAKALMLWHRQVGL